MTMNEIWALPGQPRIITNWADCTGEDWSTLNPVTGQAPWPFATRYADRCSSSQDIVDVLAPSLEARTDDGGALVTGIYTLFIQATPEPGCLDSVASLAPRQADVATAIKGWHQQNQHNAPANLNVLAGDFVTDPRYLIVQTALDLNKTAPAPQLTLSTDQNGVQVSCTSPQGTGLQMVAYPSALDPRNLPRSLEAVRFQGNSPGQLDLVRNQFPAGDHFDNVRVDCTTTDGLTSSLAISPSDLPGECCPQEVGTFIQADGSPEIDVMAPGCQRRPLPNLPTYHQIPVTWKRDFKVLDPADFNNLPQGAAIPDYSTQPHDFMLAMEDIYGAPCASFRTAPLNLNIGALIQATGQPAVYVLAGGCQIRGIPNPTTLGEIQARSKQTVQSLNQTLLEYFVRGPNIPDFTTNQDAFNQAMQEIYKPTLAETPPKRVSIDIKPKGAANRLNLVRRVAIPVAILSTGDFDATTVDPLSVKFGRAGAGERHSWGHIRDVNEDGRKDLVLHFLNQETGIQPGATEACLTGTTLAGVSIIGCDRIKTRPAK
jgi:hypothetical protein